MHDGCKERNNGLPFKLKCDKDLKRIDNEEYHWENNNWFEPSFRKKSGDWDCLLGEVEHTYGRAIKMGKDMLKDEEFWKQK